MRDLIPDSHAPEITAPIIMGATAEFFDVTLDDWIVEEGLKAGDKINVSIVSRHLEKGVDPVPWDVSRGEIDRVIAFTHVECAAIYLDRANSLGD